MKSKLFPQCKQRIHPVLNIYYYSLTGWYWTPGDIHNPTRKVAALGVLGGAKGGSPKTNNASRDQNKTEQCKRKRRKSIPPAMPQRNQHLTHAMLRKPATTAPKQFQTTWCFGKDWRHAGGARDLQSATVFPGILPFRYTCKSIAFWWSCAIFRKKGHCSNLIFGAVNTLAFWTPRSGPPQLRWKLAAWTKPNGLLA